VSDTKEKSHFLCASVWFIYRASNSIKECKSVAALRNGNNMPLLKFNTGPWYQAVLSNASGQHLESFSPNGWSRKPIRVSSTGLKGRCRCCAMDRPGIAAATLKKCLLTIEGTVPQNLQSTCSHFFATWRDFCTNILIFNIRLSLINYYAFQSPDDISYSATHRPTCQLVHVRCPLIYFADWADEHFLLDVIRGVSPGTRVLYITRHLAECCGE